MSTAISEDRFDPDQVRFHQFRMVRRGYDPDEVGVFLGDISEHLVGLEEQVAEARQREQATRAVADRLHKENESLRGMVVSDGLPTQPMPNLDQAHREAEQLRAQAELILEHAQAQAREIVAEARHRAQGIHLQAEAHIHAIEVADTNGQSIEATGQSSMAATIAQRAELILEAEQRVADARRSLLLEAEQVTAAAQQAIVRLATSDEVELPPPPSPDDTMPTELPRRSV